MKQAALPIVFAIIMIVIAKLANPIVEVGGIFIAGLIGAGIGVALNSVVFREKKSAEKQ